MTDFTDMEGDFQDFIESLEKDKKNDNACSLDNPEGCDSCGS